MYWILLWLCLVSVVPTRADAPEEASAADCHNGSADLCHVYAITQLERSERMAKNAMELLEANCRRGNGSSCFKVASLLQAKKDPRAAEFFHSACDKGDFAGCTNLSSVQQKLKNTNTQQLIKLLKRSCDNGLIKGCINLATTYEQSGDFESAEKVYRTICNNHETQGLRAFGQMQEKRGKLEKALDAFRIACNGGRKIACLWINSIELRKSQQQAPP